MIDSDQYIWAYTKAWVRLQEQRKANASIELGNMSSTGTALAIYPGETINPEEAMLTIDGLKITGLSEMKERVHLCPSCSREVDSFGRPFGPAVHLDENAEVQICNECRKDEFHNRVL